MTGDDPEVAVRAAAGDRAAFESLVDRFGGRVRALAMRMTGGREAWADDLTQDLFVHLLRVLPRYDKRRPFTPWILHVAANLFRNKLRGERRRPHQSLDQLAESGGLDPASGPSLDPAEIASHRDMLRRVRSARDLLADDHREILALHYEAGLSYETIAETLGGLPLGTVKNRLHRARAALAARLGISEAKD